MDLRCGRSEGDRIYFNYPGPDKHKEGWTIVLALTEFRNHDSKFPLFDGRKHFILRSCHANKVFVFVFIYFLGTT